MIGVVVCLFRCFGRSSSTTDIHLIPCHIVDDGVARDRIATLSDCGLTDKCDNIIDFIQFDNLTQADDVLQFLIGPFMMDLSLRWLYKLQWLKPEELPEHLRAFVARVSEEQGIKHPRFAMIDDGLSFQLVPWTPSLDRQIGKHISGVMRAGGGVDWSFGRGRGLGL